MTTATVTKVPSLIGGQWREIETDRHAEVFNPSTGESSLTRR